MPFEEPQIEPDPEESSEKEEDFSVGELLRKKYPDNFKDLGQTTKGDPDYDLVKKWEPKNPNAWIDLWYGKMNDFHQRHRDPETMRLIKNSFHEKYVINPENIPESYYQNQRRMARERGHGDVEIPEELRREGAENIIVDQKVTLDNWVNYLFSRDADVYPMWAKYWAIQSITKLSTYDKEKKCFGKRRNDTVAPFPDLDREALAFVVNIIVKKARKENIEGDANLKKLAESENFGKLYAYAIEEVTPAKKYELMETGGEWIKYRQGSDHMPLVRSLQGYGTGWCTAGESTAQIQLKGGDFYVYYSKDKDGNCKIPRAAIRMEGNNIGEVRGIAADQNLDPYIGSVVDEKLKGFPDAEEYRKKTADMEFLTAIEKKQKGGQELTKDDLGFLYEIDSKIEGFGYQKDPRIVEIINQRNIKNDLSLVTSFLPGEIGITESDVLKGDIEFYFGNFDFDNLCFCGGAKPVESLENFNFPKKVSGNIDFHHLFEIRGNELMLENPQKMNGGKPPIFNIRFAGNIDLSSVDIGGFCDFSNLRYAKGLKLPNRTKNLNLGHVESVDDLILPRYVDGDLNLYLLFSATGVLKLPETVIGNVYLTNMQFADGLDFSDTEIGGDLVLNALENVKNLTLPKKVMGHLLFESLKTAEDMIFPDIAVGGLNLRGVKSLKNVQLPMVVDGDLYMGALQHVENVKFPQSIAGNLYLSSFKDIIDLTIPSQIGGKIFLPMLTPAEKNIFFDKNPEFKNQPEKLTFDVHDELSPVE